MQAGAQETAAQAEANFQETLMDESNDFVPPEFFDEEPAEEPAEAEKLTVEQQILQMSVTEKIVTAMRGNKQIRGILIREGNKLISTAVLNNPRITDAEVIKFAASRGLSEDVIRGITRNREWMKMYQVKLSLVGNPKCPTPIALRLLTHLRAYDLRQLMSNKNIPSVVATNAKKLVKQKKK